MSVVEVAIWDDLESIFIVYEACRRPTKNRQCQKVITFSNDRTIQRDTKSDRPDPVPASPHALDAVDKKHLCELPQEIVQAILCNTKKHHEQTVKLPVFENVHMRKKGVMGTVHMTVLQSFQNMVNQHSNSIWNF